MTTILHIDSSANLQHSVTRALTRDTITGLLKQHPEARVITRDVTANPLPHISPEFLAGLFAKGETASPDTLKLSNELLEELFAADLIVIGAPMYNFSVPSQLKAWIDHVVRAGRTFQYTASGVQGLLSGKRAIVAVASGGTYEGGPLDHAGAYLQQILGLMGIADVAIIRAEKQAYGPEAAADSMAQARHKLEAETARAA
jgi:FMN-dependent NADH-azoreductase